MLTEYQELLACSTGGGVVKGARVPLLCARGYSESLHSLQVSCLLLPIGLNGGGMFYVYYFQRPGPPSIAAGNIDYESAVELGKSLVETLQANTSTADALRR